MVLHVLARRTDEVIHNLPAPDSESFTNLLARFSQFTLAICVRRRSGKEHSIVKCLMEEGEHDISSYHISQMRNVNTLQ
jgi:hypothetical protein